MPTWSSSPGPKNTVKDLLFLKERGLDHSVKSACSKGIRVMGMCGGYQMLGKKILDPHGVESEHRDRGDWGFSISRPFRKRKDNVPGGGRGKCGMRNVPCTRAEHS